MKITFLHTSNAHIKRFTKIVKEIDSTIEVEHHVNDKLLETALTTNQTDKEGFNKEILKIKQAGGENIICTCSTYGDLCDEQENVFRIDQPIGEFIVSNFQSIGIAFTVKSTKEISKELLQSLAKERNKSIRIEEIDCQNCWHWFEKGDSTRYELEISKQIKKLGNNCAIIFLAQASMEGAKKYLTKEKYQVVSSPKFGVEKYVAFLQKREERPLC